jgi:CheY-like chemotaxis protein
VVDDEPAVAQVVARAIVGEFPHVEVMEAHDGFHAGTLVANTRPDLVLLDLRMPGMDGFQVCKMIREQPATKQTEIVAMTAFPSPETEKRILECGARICLHKPLDMEQLLREVAASL